MSYRIEHRDSARDIAPSAWRSLAGSELLYASRAFALITESDPLFECRYLLAWDEQRLVAALPAYLPRGEVVPDYDPPRLLEADEEGSASPPLLLGGRGGYANRILIAPDLPAAERRQVLAMLGATIDELLTGELDTDVVAALYCDERSALDALALLGPAASAHWLTAGVAIEAGPEGFATYPDELRPSRRGLVRRERRKFAAAGLDVSSDPFDDEAVGAAIPLLAATERKHGGHLDPPRFAERMAAQRRELGEALRWIACRRDGRLVGCLTYTLWEDTVYAQQIGLDYEETGEAGEYFNLVVHLPIAVALAAEGRVVDLSTEGWRAKVLRGGRTRPRWGVARGIDASRATEVEKRRLAQFRDLMEELGEDVPEHLAGTTAVGDRQ